MKQTEEDGPGEGTGASPPITSPSAWSPAAPYLFLGLSCEGGL